MSIDLLEYTQAEITGSIPQEMPAPVQIITFDELKQREKELEEKQAKLLKECKNVEGDLRCGKCGSSLWSSEVRIQYVDGKTKKPTGTLYVIKEVWYCINTDCGKPPPLVSSIGVIRPEIGDEEDKIRGYVAR